MPIKDLLEELGKTVQKNAKERLAALGRSDTGQLANSIKYEVRSGKDNYKLTISTLEYGAYIDQGVRGKSSSSRAPQSPFRFGSGKGKKGGLTTAIETWVKRKKIQFKDKGTGKFLSSKQTAFLITRSVYNKGIKTSGFLTKPFEDEFFRLPKKLATAYLPEILEEIRKALKQ
ncbi:hypothetical protein HYN59_07200 [Flavobacterium album]|uniref:Phage morphogenesis protein n=1 Tax=Flavobacterium album TaxID=2175091 RepID=A0A2S1QWZ8_9FLAO|nr:HK97 gp10 family phage protein [Flavobacterium album]AWH84925.1 hypothetical protein HYN59_07200 [Flavobacterium album]